MNDRVLCSHKNNVLDFLDQLCLLYKQKYFLAPAVEVEGTQTFIDKVCELAEANGLPSEGYRSALLKFSADEVRRHLNKVFLVSFPFKKITFWYSDPIHGSVTSYLYIYSFDCSTFQKSFYASLSPFHLSFLLAIFLW